MTGGKHNSLLPRPVRQVYVQWYRCVIDGLDHAVRDENFARGLHDGHGRYDAICGHQVLIGSTLLPPGTRCPRCSVYLRAIASRPLVEARMRPHRHRKPSRLRRLFQPHKPPAVPSPRLLLVASASQRDGRASPPVGADSTPMVSASTGSTSGSGVR